MMKSKTLGWAIAASAQLALAAIICITLTTNTLSGQRNTSQLQKLRATVAAPSQKDVMAQVEVSRLNKAMAALSKEDAAAYRTIFISQKEGDWAKADRFLMKIEDKRLVGSIMADRFERRGATGDQLVAWLKAFATQPEAKTLYAKAIELGEKNPPSPRNPDLWGSGNEIDSAADFSVERLTDEASASPTLKTIQRAARKARFTQAEKALSSAITKQTMSSDEIADAKATLAEAYFRKDLYKEALANADDAAKAGQPLGLWIRGLLAWEKKDAATARKVFDRLTRNKNLNESNKAAAHFWTYRAEKAGGSRTLATKHLKTAALTPLSFYGLLASELLDDSPTDELLNGSLPDWSNDHRSIIASTQAGWRALALIQVGEMAKAEAELRHLNPHGSSRTQRAMLALAHFVPMPALTLRLATLSKARSFDQMAYPLLPWKPTGGYVIDRALLFALARHESMFNTKAISSRGARGLMQIMPSTADGMMAKDQDLSALAEGRKLIDPSLNITLGQKYVQTLAKFPHIGNNLMLLLAAYNGGPTKTQSWLKGKEDIDPLLFMESIPIRETRTYIARVLPHYWAYRVRLGRSTTALKALAEGQWPTASLYEPKTVRVALIAE